MTIPTGKGQWALVPSIVNGKFLTPDGKMPKGKAALQQLEDAARKHYEKSGEHLGIFSSQQAADKYAEETHSYIPDGSDRKVYVAPRSKR